MMTTSAESRMVRKHFQARMREYLTDDEIYQALLPSFAVGCRRLTPGDPYMKAVQQRNVTVHRAALAKVKGNTIIGSNGTQVEVDTLICATGFDLNYTPKYPVKGRNGVLLQDKWAEIPQGYVCICVELLYATRMQVVRLHNVLYV